MRSNSKRLVDVLMDARTLNSQSYFLTIFAEKYDNMHFPNEQLTNLITKIVKRVLSKDSCFYRDETSLRNTIKEEIGEEKFTVMHEKGSYKKYGDAAEYGFVSWMDYCEQCSVYRESIISIKECPCCGGPMTNMDGAHVVEIISRKIFITPTCHTCNTNAATDETFRLSHIRNKIPCHIIRHIFG